MTSTLASCKLVKGDAAVDWFPFVVNSEPLYSKKQEMRRVEKNCGELRRYHPTNLGFKGLGEILTCSEQIAETKCGC